MPIINAALTLKDLPPPPPGKLGWPWTDQSQSLLQRLPDGFEWPLISIVTPSYNQGQYIEETIRSVLLQGYPNLEFIIIDGTSTDNSVEIIRKYESWLTYWVSEPDKGQSDAIQKGFSLCTGVIWNWLNSDDLLEPNALQTIGITYQNHSSATIYSGYMTIFGQGESVLAPKCFEMLSELVCIWEKWAVPQPSVFLSRESCLKVKGLNTSLHYGMDYELYLRLSQLPRFNVQSIDTTVARIRRHPLSKTVSQQPAFMREIFNIFDDFAKNNLSTLPKGWRKSRELCAYISDLKFAEKCDLEESPKIPINSFITVSLKHLNKIWKYRYFWGTFKRILIKRLNILISLRNQ
uniref:glycosyltransferase family 2 protein n=1 Tax=Trichocoleus desertorum TaxID=1481672 RepID=UPI0025B5D805|nr:glycosyltransferase family 2 protein [Trichocoleus desertorum]